MAKKTQMTKVNVNNEHTNQGGGTKLYRHYISFDGNDGTSEYTIISKRKEEYTYETLLRDLNNGVAILTTGNDTADVISSAVFSIQPDGDIIFGLILDDFNWQTYRYNEQDTFADYVYDDK